MANGRVPFTWRRVLARAVRRPATTRRRVWVLVIGLVLIALWQRDFFRRAPQLDTRYAIVESRGMNEEWRFLYFLYYLGLLPVVAKEGHVASLGESGYKKFRREAAERVIVQRGETLSMEFGNTIRAGEMGRTLLYLPHAIWTGSARDPRLATTHAVTFTLALAALYGAFWWVRDPVLGAVCVVLLGSNPFQLHAVHLQENIWGWPITAGMLTLALALPLLGRCPPRRSAWALAGLIGVLLGTVRQIRPEPAAIVASTVAACLLLAHASWRRRAALAGLVAGSFLATGSLWQAYFDHKFEEARRVVTAAGGAAYQGPRDRYHMFWHPFWCGLGDFDDKYGYEWSDAAAKRFALPRMREHYRRLGQEWDGVFLFWDAHYNRLLVEKIRHDITHDPVWYLGILARRVGRVLAWTTPVRAAVGPWHVDLPWTGLAVVPALVALAWARSWPLLKLGLFPLGTSLSTILVFSGTRPGQTYTGWFHVVGAAIVLSGAIHATAEVGRLLRRKRG